MGHTIGDGLIVTALAAAFVASAYLKHAGRRQRLELLHQERLAAMEKGIPLPELPFEPPRAPDPNAPLLHGLVWTALGAGGIAALTLVPSVPDGLWPLALPLVALGLGLVLYHALVSRR